jgi:hypothetical protein
MAQKRMFTQQIIDSDAFLDMPLSAQALYFHLNMRADDDGFIDNPKKIQRLIGANPNDLDILLAKRFVLFFENGVLVIKHWKLHNTIQKDRYKETVYLELKNRLNVKENKAYTEKDTLELSKQSDKVKNVSNVDTDCIHNVNTLDTQIRLGLDLDKIRLDKNSKELKEKNTKKKVANASVMTSQTLSELDKTLIEFETMRKSMKKTLTEHAKKLLLAKLEKLSKGDEALMVEILNQSILNGWQGIFPFQQDNNTKGSNKSLKVSDWDSLM